MLGARVVGPIQSLVMPRDMHDPFWCGALIREIVTLEYGMSSRTLKFLLSDANLLPDTILHVVILFTTASGGLN